MNEFDRPIRRIGLLLKPVSNCTNFYATGLYSKI